MTTYDNDNENRLKMKVQLPKINKHVSAKAQKFAELEYEFDGYEREWLSKGYYHGYMDAMKEIELSPEDRIMKAIYGDKWKTEEERESEIDEAVNSVTDEEYKRIWGKSIDESVQEIMSRIKDIEKKEALMDGTIQASECKCCVCGKQAYAFWPVIDPDIPSHPYCEKCLHEQQMKVIIGVMGEKEGKKAYRQYQMDKKRNS